MKADRAKSPVSNRENVIILGTSPVLLIEGLFRARAGEKVLFLDAKHSRGGAWSLTEAFGLSEIENACHLIVNYRHVYDFLERQCGIPMRITSPAPELLSRQRLTRFNSRKHLFRRSLGIMGRLALASTIRGIEKLLRGRWRWSKLESFSFARSWENLVKRTRCPVFATASDRAIRYPVGGSPEMLRRLEKQLIDLGAEFRYGQAEALEINKDKTLGVSTKGGEFLRAERIVVSESVALDRIVSSAGKRYFSSSTASYSTLILSVRGSPLPFLSYVELPFDPLVERVSDVSDFCVPSPSDGCRILVCEIPGKEIKGENALFARKVLDYLKTKEIIPPAVEMRDFAFRPLELRRGDADLLRALKNLDLDSVCIVLSRGDLAWTIYRNRSRWLGMEMDRPEVMEQPESVSFEYSESVYLTR